MRKRGKERGREGGEGGEGEMWMKRQNIEKPRLGCVYSPYLQLHSATAGKSAVPVPAPFQDQALDKQSNDTSIMWYMYVPYSGKFLKVQIFV